MKLKIVMLLFAVVTGSLFAIAEPAFAHDKSNPVKPTNNKCQLLAIGKQQVLHTETLVFNQRHTLELPKGINLIRLECDLDNQSILRFGRRNIVGSPNMSSAGDVQQIPSPSPSYLLPAAAFEVEFELDLYFDTTQYIYWQALNETIQKSTIQNLVMGTFYGICTALIIYVFCMGRILGDKSFQLYSLYVFCATVFFLLQEGQLNIVFPAYSFELGHYWYIFFAALTVCSATVFIVNITDVNKMWPRVTYYVLFPAALSVMLLALVSLYLKSNPLADIADIVMARITLLIMLAVLVLVFIQTLKKVQLAWLVLLSLLLMISAMAIRTLPFDVSPFMQRYSLVLAFAIEAFIFAIVIMMRIQLIKHEKLLAQTEANTDVLCEVLNRRGWMQQAELLISKQAKQGGVIGTLFIDIDKFKSINDTHGHEVGDQVLSIVARIISNQTRQGELVGRLGGDEFVVVGLFDSQRETVALAERIQERLSNTALQINDRLSIEVSASLGYVIIDEPMSITEILRQADREMYQKKRAKLEMTGIAEF